MRVLFIPYPDGISSHGISLMALKQRCDDSIDAAFLLPRSAHHLGRLADIEVLNYDFTGKLETEWAAYRHYHPDVIVDDCNPSTYYASAQARLPRVTILRMGAFPGHRPRHPHHVHTLPVLDRVARWVGPSTPTPTISELCTATVHIIPAVPTIEEPTAVMFRDSRFVYSGPLVLSDDWTMRFMMASDRIANVRAGLEQFFARNEKRSVAFMTFGIAQGFREEGRSCVRRLIEQGIAVVSTFSVGELEPASRDLHYWTGLVPMNYVCAHAAVMIHQCGSGTYHYPLFYGIPTVTIGTGYFDREDVALRLQDLGVSRHVAQAADERNFGQQVANATRAWFDARDSGTYAASVQSLQKEITRVSAAFRLGSVLELALTLGRQQAVATS